MTLMVEVLCFADTDDGGFADTGDGNVLFCGHM